MIRLKEPMCVQTAGRVPGITNRRFSNWFSLGQAVSYWNGLDDVRYYNRALSTAEIQQLYKQGGGKISKSPTNITTGLNTGLVGGGRLMARMLPASQVLDKAGQIMEQEQLVARWQRKNRAGVEV